MFLATTALQEFWDPSKEILFLGSWCLTADTARLAFERPYRIMPSPWDDRSRYYQAASYIDSCCEALLHELHEYLNNIHGTTHSEKYWRIILGPWLILYTAIVYDRFIHLRTAFDTYPNLETMGMHESSFQVPADFNESDLLASSDPYNLQIFSQLLKVMNLPCSEKSYSGSFGPVTKASSTRDRILHIAEKCLRLPFQRRARVTIRKTSLSPVESWKLAWATGFRFLPLDFNFASKFDQTSAIFNEARLSLRKLPSNDLFQRVFTDLLPSHFPTLYLEGYPTAAASVSRMRQTPVFVSGYAWSGDEKMKFCAGQAMENGSRLVSVQHGGGYGVYRSAPYELHERRLSDRFLSWGWAGDGLKNTANVVNPRFPRLEDQSAGRKSGNTVLFIATGQPRYLYRFHSCPAGTQWDNYYEWQCAFFAGLSEELRTRVIFRPYPANYGHRGELHIRNSFPSLTWDSSPTLVHEKFATARILVIDHLGTALLEALAANIPTILFWDPNRWEVRPEAEPYFEPLRQAQILWHSPAGAAQKLARSYEEPGAWWNSQPVQTARRNFVNRHAMTKQNWMQSWIDSLNQISSSLGGMA